jgi:diamine oxidase
MTRMQPEMIDLDKIKDGEKGAAGMAPRKGLPALVILALVLLAAATIGLIVALAVVASEDNSDTRGPCPSKAEASLSFPPRVAAAFEPFTQEELDEIAAHVTTTLGLDSGEPSDTDGHLIANWLYAVDFLPRPKVDITAHIDDGAAFSGRLARAIVYHLDQPSPAVVEYKVGPISGLPIAPATPVTAIQQDGKLGGATEIPFLMRPVSPTEYLLMEPLVVDAFHVLSNLSDVSYGEQYDDGNIYWTDSAPRGYDRASRQTWIWCVWYMEGMFQLPIGIQMLIDHKSLNASEWSIIELSYNGQGPFSSPQDLADEFNAGNLEILTYPRPVVTDWDTAPLWSSMRRRGDARPLETRPLPAVVTLGGQRYVTDGRQVKWLGWDMHIGYTFVQGTHFNDIRFRDERIIYELSMQDAYASYSGMMPLQALSQYSDGGWGMGRSNFELMPGIDCPAFATMFDTHYFAEGKSGVNKNSVCIWEQPENMAVMRHYDQDVLNGGGFTFVAGFPKTVLVVRTTSTVYNYDYYFSYIFHLDGNIQITTYASGYLQADIYPSGATERANEAPFMNRVNLHSIGSLHDHLFGFKVDMDVLGTSNSLMRSDIKVGTFAKPWNTSTGGNTQKLKYADRYMVPTELETNSTYVLNPAQPSMLMAVNTGAENGGKNAWGTHRAYAIHIPGTAIQLLGDDTAWMPSTQWTKYSVAVTQRHESEYHSCRVLYDMQAPSEPLVEFDDYTNGESLVQQDLVFWVTVGAMHLPTSEDAPVTTTPGTSAGFFIRPNNYFDESPVTDLTRRFFKVGSDTYSGGAPVTAHNTAVLESEDRCYDDSSLRVYGA